MEPEDAGVVIDAIRCCKLALDNKVGGALEAPSSYFKKSPPVQIPDDEARRLTEEFITKYGWKTKTTKVGRVKKAAKSKTSKKPATKKAAKTATKKRVVKKKK